MVRTASPQDGSLTLVFADNPLALRQWTVVDAQRQETRVTLFDVQLGGSFDQALFVLRRRGRRNRQRRSRAWHGGHTAAGAGRSPGDSASMTSFYRHVPG